MSELVLKPFEIECDMCGCKITKVDDILPYCHDDHPAIVFFCRICSVEKSDLEYALTMHEPTRWKLVPLHFLRMGDFIREQLILYPNRSAIRWHIEDNNMLKLHNRWDKNDN